MCTPVSVPQAEEVDLCVQVDTCAYLPLFQQISEVDLCLQVNTSAHLSLYQQVDEADHPDKQGSYKKLPDQNYTPVDTAAPLTAPVPSFTAPSGDTYAMVSKKKPPTVSHDLHGE